ncbi:hypothetical protein GKA92_24455 [Salmonella enterica subsp. enterica]|nr:hypothetical protein [Salmonella enterica subsp. enterica serovar Abaetetuba]
MGTFVRRTSKFSRALEPTVERQVSAEHFIEITDAEYENIERIEFSTPKMGSDGFGMFKVVYKTPVLCESNK